MFLVLIPIFSFTGIEKLTAANKSNQGVQTATDGRGAKRATRSQKPKGNEQDSPRIQCENGSK